ncbi:MAG: hypothetical protein AABZ32_04075 [Bacteroidota bacterium]
MRDNEFDPYEPIHAVRKMYKLIALAYKKLNPKIQHEPHYLVIMIGIFSLFVLCVIVALYLCVIWPIESITVERLGQFADFVNGIWNPIFGVITVIGVALTLYFQVMQNVALKKQLQDNTRDQLESRKRETFFNASSFLSQIVDRVAVNQETKEKAFILWCHFLIQKCDKKVLNLAINDFEPTNLEWYIEIITRRLSDFHFPRRGIIDKSSFASLVNSYNGIGNILQVSEVKEQLMIDFWSSASEEVKDEIVKTSCEESFDTIGYQFGPFFKTVMRILEISNGDDDNISLFKAQLTAHQMISLQANAICGLCNEEHDKFVRDFKITNDASMINNPYVKHLGEMYECFRYKNKQKSDTP